VKGFWLILLSLAIVIGVVLIMFVLQIIHLGAWHADKGSSYADRARAVDASLQAGMTRQQVRKIFQDDINAHPEDRIDDTTGSSVMELVITEPRHFPDAADAGWIVRASFDRRKALLGHGVNVEPLNGP